MDPRPGINVQKAFSAAWILGLLLGLALVLWLLTSGRSGPADDDISPAGQMPRGPSQASPRDAPRLAPGSHPRAGRPQPPLVVDETPDPHWLHIEVRLLGSGEPLEGIRVRALWSRERFTHTPGTDGEQTAASDAEGRIKFGPLPPGPLVLTAYASDCVAGHGSVDFMPGGEGPMEDPRLVLRLRGTQAFSGHVYAPDGSPAAGIGVRAEASAGGEWREGSGYTRTASDGSFRFQGVAVGYVCVLRASGGRVTDSRKGWALARPGQEDVRIDLREKDVPSPLYSLAVRVVDPQGAPVPAFRVRVRHDGLARAKVHMEPGRLVCDTATGPTWIQIWDARTESGAPLPLGPLLAGPFDGICRNGGGEYTVVLPSEMTYVGRVIDSKGNGIAGAKLTAYWWSEKTREPGEREALASSETTADGSFRLGGLPQGKVRVFVAQPEGFAHRIPLEVTPGPDPVEVVLNFGVTATLLIVNDDDEPLSGVQVAVCLPELDDHTGVGWGLPPGWVTRCRTRDDGIAVLPALDPSREYLLRINWSYRFRRGGVFPHVDPTWRAADGVIKLPRSYVVQGRVTNAQGAPISRVSLRLSQEGGEPRLSESGQDGTFSFGGLRAGEYTLEAWASGSDTEQPAAVSTSVSAGARHVLLTLLPGTRATGDGAADK